MGAASPARHDLRLDRASRIAGGPAASGPEAVPHRRDPGAAEVAVPRRSKLWSANTPLTAFLRPDRVITKSYPPILEYSLAGDLRDRDPDQDLELNHKTSDIDVKKKKVFIASCRVLRDTPFVCILDGHWAVKPEVLDLRLGLCQKSRANKYSAIELYIFTRR